MADSWNSVQIATIIVDAATPVTVAVLGVIFARASRKIEQVQWANQTVVTRPPGRLRQARARAEPVALLRHVRRWLEGDRPTQGHRDQARAGRDHVREQGAVLRRVVQGLPPLHERPVRHVRHHGRRCEGPGPIRSEWGTRRDLGWWDDTLAALFTEKAVGLDDIQAAYDALGEQFRTDLYVTHQARPLLTPQG
jgi:hypothetical protein